MNSRRLIAAPEDRRIVLGRLNPLKGGDPVNVRFASKADICAAISHVRFTPKSGHVRCTSLCPLWADSGHRGNPGVCFVGSPRRQWRGGL
jgi:hypothetical protein